MKTSRFVNVDPNVLIEYIYDDNNVIGETYQIISNSLTQTNCFVSYGATATTNNDANSQLFIVDQIQNKFGQFNSDTYTFLQLNNYGTSVPLRYDTIRLHFPISYAFDVGVTGSAYIGCHVRAYTLDYNNQNFYDLTNYFFNITDLSDYYRLEYTSPAFIFNEALWGKYLDIDIPAVSELSGQMTNGIVNPNTINYNLTNGVGLSTTAPVFVDFYFINSLTLVNSNPFFDLTPQITITVPQTPEYENLGIVIEPSTEGDFFSIYATYNNSAGDFNVFINQAAYNGSNYHVQYEIQVYEKNILTSDQTIIVTNDFIDPIEFRPILLFTTTTAVINVILSLIDNYNYQTITKTASYGMLQDEVAIYSSKLTKIDLSLAPNQFVYNIKTKQISDISGNPFGIQPILNIDKLNFSLFSQTYYITDDTSNAVWGGQTYLGMNQTLFIIYPFDNIIEFNMITLETPSSQQSTQYIPYNFNQMTGTVSGTVSVTTTNSSTSNSTNSINSSSGYSNTIGITSSAVINKNLKLTIMSPTQTLNYFVYFDSDQNNFSNGTIVFRIPENRYQDIKKIYNQGYNVFYINGLDINGNKTIIYSGVYVPYDSVNNVISLNNIFESSQTITTINTKIPSTTSKNDTQIANVKQALDSGLNIAKGVNVTTIDTPTLLKASTTMEPLLSSNTIGQGKSTIPPSTTLDTIVQATFTPFWLCDPSVIIFAYGQNNYQSPGNIPQFQTYLLSAGIINQIGTASTTSNLTLQYVLGYFKGLNLNPTQTVINYFASNASNNNPYNDITDYINSGLSTDIFPQGKAQNETSVITGSMLPISITQFNLIKNQYNLSLQSTQSATQSVNSISNASSQPNTSGSLINRIIPQ